LIKGGILSNRVNKFVRYVKASDPGERAGLKQSSEFRQLDEDIKAFMWVFYFQPRDEGWNESLLADVISQPAYGTH
jgi:hypothetical protein